MVNVDFIQMLKLPVTCIRYTYNTHSFALRVEQYYTTLLITVCEMTESYGNNIYAWGRVPLMQPRSETKFITSNNCKRVMHLISYETVIEDVNGLTIDDCTTKRR
jgi:hypothetical protein